MIKWKTIIISFFILLVTLGIKNDIWRYLPPVANFIPWRIEYVYPGTKASPVAFQVANQPILPPILERIAQCESGNSHFDSNGHILRGNVNRMDSGLFQINLTIHQAKALSLGYDIETKEGNIKYAKWLFEHYGTEPWKASENCWGK